MDDNEIMANALDEIEAALENTDAAETISAVLHRKEVSRAILNNSTGKGTE